MAPVKISHVVSFSSQDPRYPVENLLHEDELRPWLNCPHDRSRQLRVELQLERASPIGYVDVGNCGCAFLQIEVGRSSWPLDHPYLTLVPGVALMTPADAKLERNRCGVRMFKEADFPALAVGQKWDRVRLTCSQPFNRHSQFGLAFLCVRTPLDSQHPPVEPQNSPVDPQHPPLEPQNPPLDRQHPQHSLEEAKPANSPWYSNPAFSRIFFPEPYWNSREEEQLRTLLQQLEPGTRSLARLSRPAQMVLSAARSRALRPRTGTERPEGDPPENTGGHVVPGSTQDIPAAPTRAHRQPKNRQQTPSSAGRAPAAASRPSKAGGRARAQSCQERGDSGVGSRGTGPCPICSGRFSLELLPTHASTCGEEDPAAPQPSSRHAWVCCPICNQPFSPAEVEQHASSCGEDGGG